jgi:tetratricopeptide (TPR) repeat protein
MKILYPVLISVFIFLLNVGISHHLYSSENTKTKVLLEKLSNARHDTTRVNILLKLAQEKSYSDINASEAYARQALKLSQQIDYKKGLAYANFRLSSVFLHFEYDFSENLALQALEQAKEMDDSILMAMVYNTLGVLKKHLKLDQDALHYYNQSLNIYLRHKQDSVAAAIYSNLGVLHGEMPGDSLSLPYYQKALEINRRTKNYSWLCINYMNIGSYLMEHNKPEEGFDYLQQGMTIAEEHGFNRLFPWLYNYHSHYYSIIGNEQEAINYANKALQSARDNDNKQQELEALNNLKEEYLKMSDINKAYLYLEEINIVKDSINKHKRLKELDLLEMRYKYEEERNEQELETAVLEAKLYRKELTYLLIILVAGVVIFTFVFLFFTQRYKIRRKTLEQKNTLLEKEKLAKDLEFKNKELTTNVLYLLKKNEFISGISNKLKNTDFDSSTKSENTIDRIISELDKSISNDNWEDFEVRFQEVHVGFYNNLGKEFPSLTPNELRLCAFLRLNMTSKEIAEITLQSTDSIKTARYRLRKKLNLEREDNLIAFLTKM